MTADLSGPAPIPRPRQSIDLTEEECWQLLRSVPIGRVVFTHHAMPAIRPVNHLIEGRTIVMRTHLSAAIASRSGSVVCYEADSLDPVRHTGWSVIATGLARLVTDPAQIARYATAVEPWIAGEMDQAVIIEPRFMSGIRLVGWCG